MLSEQKKTAEKFLSPIVAHLSKVDPNILTLIGSIPPLLFFVCVVTHHYFLALIAFAGNALDMLDGMVARRYHKATSFGAFFDSSLDRVSDFLIITAFSFGGIVRWEITAPFLLFSFLISYARSRSETLSQDRNLKFNVGLMERTERLIAVLVALILYLILPNMNIFGLNIAEVIFALLVVLSFYTALQRILYAYEKLR